MKHASLLRSSFCAIALLSSVFAASAQELVTNGGFETGDFTGWTLNDPSPMAPPSLAFVGSNSTFSHGPTHHAYLASDPGIFATLSQNIATTPGQSYDLSFWLTGDRSQTGATASNEFDIFWNGALLQSYIDIAPAGGATIGTYLNYTFTNLPASTGSTTTLQFRFRNNDDYFRLDDVTVTAAVPEASTMSFALLGLGLLVGCSAYRKTKSSRSTGSR